MLVTKRDGSTEEFNIQKITRVLNWATKGLKNVSSSDIEIGVNLGITENISTNDLHSLLVESSANLISVEKDDYQYVAGRLLNYQIRKQVWGGKKAPTLLDLINKNVNSGHYTKNLLKWYSTNEINKIGELIDHNKDMDYTYVSVKQLCDKYLVKDNITKSLKETPQFRYIVCAMTVFHKYVGKKRFELIKKAYDHFSNFRINLPTPILAWTGTGHNSFSSCCLIDMLDTKESINATVYSVSSATAAGYGIGVNFGRMRAVGDGIKNNTIIHPGVLPFLKLVESSCKAWRKGSVRGGGATVTFPIWHKEIMEVLQLKNSTTGTHDNRVFNLDYSIVLTKLFLDRLAKKENVSLFSPNDVPGLYEAFGLPGFDTLYAKYEADPSISRRTVSAYELFSLLFKERKETGRIYILFLDNANKYSSWAGKIDFSNLCQEVLHNINSIQDINHPDSETGVCILAALNWLNIENDAQLEECCDITVRMLEEVIDIQDYYDVSAENFAKKKRSLGIGMTNMAAFLARNRVKYSDDSALELVNEWSEKQQYFLIKSSIQLAKERGPCELQKASRYSTGWLPIDKELPNAIVPKMDWEKLRADLKRYGIRHCTLSCQMPVESSSKVQNATNGIEPIRALLTYHASKKSSIPTLAPNVAQDAKYYELAFDMKSNSGYLKLANAMQRWIDMGMSVNQYFNVKDYHDKNIPMKEILKDVVEFYKGGGKALYYLNTFDGNKQNDETNECPDGACKL